MSLLNAPRRTSEDIERLEQVPIARRLAVGSTYALLHKTVASSPEQPFRCFLPRGGPSLPGEALTARAFLGKVHQSANLLADLGMGPQDVMALLLPDLLEKELLLWAGQAAGVVCPIPATWPALQVVELLQAAQAKVLVAPAPEVDHEVWQQTEQVRRQVKSIALVLQVRGPGNEREATYAFNALVEEYLADRLHTGREIVEGDLAVCFPLRDTTGTPEASGENIDSCLFLFTKEPAIYCYPAPGSIDVCIAPAKHSCIMSAFLVNNGRNCMHGSFLMLRVFSATGRGHQYMAES